MFVLADAVLKQHRDEERRGDVRLQSVIVHETQTGYAQCFREDVENPRMGLIRLEDIVFSDQVRAEWADPEMFEKLKRGESFINPEVIPQVSLS